MTLIRNALRYVGCVALKVERAAAHSQDEVVGGGGDSGDAFGAVHELLKVAPPALAQLLSFDHLRYGNAARGVLACWIEAFG